MPRITSSALMAACVVILLAAALGMWRLEVESIWHDEAWSVRAIQSPFGTPDDNTPPLYYITLHLMQRIGAGETPFALRYGSVMMFLLLVALGFRIGWRWFGLTIGAMSGALLALSPLLWEYAQEVRAYIVIPLMALALLAGSDALLRDRESIPRRVWAFVLIVELAGLYTHNLAVPLVAWLNVVVISVWGWRLFSPSPRWRGGSPTKSAEVAQRPRRGHSQWGRGVRSGREGLVTLPYKTMRSRTARNRLGMWLVAQFVLFLAYIPWLLTQSPSGTSLNTVPAFNAELSRNVWRGYILPVIANPDELPRSFIALTHILPILFGISLVIVLLRGRTQRVGLVASQAILLPILSTFMLIAASIDFHPRYYVLAIPATLLMLPFAVATFPQKMRIGLAVVTVVVVAFITGRSFSLIVDNPDYQHDDFRAMAEYYASLPDDTLILIPYDDEPTFTNYFDVGHDIIFSLGEMSQNKNRNATRIELLTWHQVPADRRGDISCHLGARIDQAPEVFQVKGLTTTGYTFGGPPQFGAFLEGEPLPVIFEAPMTLGSNLNNQWIGYSVSEYGLCIGSAWISTGDEQSQSELRVAAQLMNPMGWDISRADGLLLNSADNPYYPYPRYHHDAANNLLLIPEGTPPGEYDILIRLYSPENPSGFDVIDNETGQSLGKDLRITVDIPGNPYDNPPENPAVLRDNTENGAIHSGLRLELELQNSFSEDMPLILMGDGWQVEETIPAGPSLAWASLQVPPDAAGDARLTFGENELAVYNIIRTERIFDEPESVLEVDAAFGDIAILRGASIDQTADEIRVNLVWRAIETPSDDYVVFVQVLDANGALLAQSDHEPERPTSSWIADEYITDSHTVNLDALNYEGQGTIIVGMYHPVTRARVPLVNGEDFVPLPTEVMIE